ncbi:MAG: right-handed parallel beta-helix repeat-containing protein [Pseudomonadota bacterium]
MRRFPIALLALVATPLSAAAFTVEETGEGYATLAGAVAAVGDGVATIRIAPGRYTDCAVQAAGRIAYRAVRPLTAIFDGGICEGKAVLVLRGRGAAVDGLVFENLKVADGNAAGIRIEQGPLSVSNSIFRNSEQGILGGGDDPRADIVIDRSTFTGLGRCDRGLACAHSVYLSAYRSVTVRRSRFEQGRGGHYVKSRSPRILVSDCSFDDSDGRATNYMIDLPEGATGRIERNIFVQGADKENHAAFIAVSAEAQRNSAAGLLVAGNRVHQVATSTWPTALLADWSGSPKAIDGNMIGLRIDRHLAIGSDPSPASFLSRVKGRLLYYAGRLRERLSG